MNIQEYRLTAGEYKVGDYLVLYAGSHHWQIRDRWGDLVDCVPTCREAVALARRWQKR